MKRDADHIEKVFVRRAVYSLYILVEDSFIFSSSGV